MCVYMLKIAAATLAELHAATLAELHSTERQKASLSADLELNRQQLASLMAEKIALIEKNQNYVALNGETTNRLESLLASYQLCRQEALMKDELLAEQQVFVFHVFHILIFSNELLAFCSPK